MPDNSFWSKLFERSALFLVFLGVILLVLAATGGLPIGNPPLQVIDLAGRVGLGVVGLILVIIGSLIAWRESDSARNHKSSPLSGKFFVKTYPRSQHPSFFAEVERLVPKAKQITLVATGLNLIWEKRIVDILIERAKSAEAQITICMGNPYSPHVQDRLIEEEMVGEQAPVGRFGIDRNTKNLIDRLRIQGNPPRFRVCLFEHYPTIATLIFDKEIFVYPYAYQLLGNTSPILHLHDDGSEEARFLIANVQRIIRDAVPASEVVQARQNRKYFSKDWIAAAVYVVPDRGEPLYKLGASLLGYDVWREQSLEPENDIIKEFRSYVGDAVDFGFHLTLGDALFFATESAIERLRAELRTISEDFRPFSLGNYRVVDRYDEVGDLVIRCDDSSGITEALHYELIGRFYKTSIASNYTLGLTKKKIPQKHAPRAILMLEKYGSPHILKAFDPHFTVCSQPPSDAARRSDLTFKLETMLQQRVAMNEVEVNEICLMLRRPGEQRWHVADRFHLSGR